ncbi:hypothetical protein RJ639_043987 [Escallonia herrerae]|uniref:DNA-3-methyladenine glycosylase I n=1 Tax=Escallonia herrerae TaxID=1293975 RepID=A0AA88WA65_9ASTE|nr:hypothetical protein RJ639_043987 [Escallonia herrerae]
MTPSTTISHINGRPVLQPTCNRVPLLERRNSLKKTPSLESPLPSQQITAAAAATPAVVSPKLKSPRQPAIKRGNDPNGLNSSFEKVVLTAPRCSTTTGKSAGMTTSVKKSKKCTSNGIDTNTLNYSATSIVEAPGSIAAARREQVAEMQVQRKMKIAHYGRTKSSKFEGKVAPVLDSSLAATANAREEKRCSFITPNSDPIYVAYHDEEWGVPAHDDKDAFSGFDAEIVSKLSEKKITSISAEYGIQISQVRGVVDNSKSILEIKKEFGSFDKYLWGFVNHKVISTQYKSCNKIPVKTSKSESISKDMVRRGFRQVGPTVIHSFMQAAGLTNDHLMTCTRHLQCITLASQRPTVAPAL